MKTNTFLKMNGEKLKIAVVQSRFNSTITDKLAAGALKALDLARVKKNNISHFFVPGSFEIPLVCQKLALAGRYHGIIAIGAIIKGETAHFEYIAQSSVRGIMDVMLKTNLPISLGVITVYNLKQAEDRCRDDDTNKGYEAAMALLEVALNYQ